MWLDQLRVEMRGFISYRCLKINLYPFVSTTRKKFLYACQIVVSKKFWRFFDGWADAFIRWHSYIIVAEETV